MKRFIAIMLMVIMTISVAACGNTPEETQPRTESFKVGNLRFSLDSGMSVREIGENTYMVTLKEREAFVTMYAGDVSNMDVDMAELFVDIQHKSFTEDRDTIILSETDYEMDIAGFSAVGEVYSTISDLTESGIVFGHIDLSFTDTWYSYTFLYQFEVGYENSLDSDSEYTTSKEYGALYSDFLNTASYIGPDPREEDTMAGGENPETTPVTDAPSTVQTESTTQTTPPETRPTTTKPTATTAPETTQPATQAPQPAGPTTSESNALKKAKEYLRVMPFSHDGLIDQLEYEGFSTADATYGADNCGADWNAQALKEAKDYLDVKAFSYSGLIDQLEYEKYTKAQATYGADNCGANWNEQAAKAAADYLDIMSFSRERLIDQLEYEGFTHEQAVYGVDSVGL